MNIPPGWYAIAESHEVPKGAAVSFERFGTRIVLWRKQIDQSIIAMTDICPHRSAQLSLGELKNDCISCPFHGFQFNEKGNCKFVPETGAAAENLQVKTFAVIEKHELIFLYWGENISSSPPWFSELETKMCYSTLTSVWQTNITRCIENQLDYAHLPFVHKKTIGKYADPRSAPTLELSEQSIKSISNPEKNPGVFLEFKFPSIWLLNIVSGKFAQFIAFVPVNENQTKLYLRAYQGFCTIPLLSNLLGLVMRQQNDVILNEDKRVVLSQLPKDSLDAAEENLYPSDKAIAFFRTQWRDKLLKTS